MYLFYLLFFLLDCVFRGVGISLFGFFLVLVFGVELIFSKYLLKGEGLRKVFFFYILRRLS